jgi:hypothetical protein
MAAGSDNRREFSRVPVPLECRLLLEDGQSLIGRLIDLSVGGVLFAADRPLAEGRPCWIEVLGAGPDSEPLVRAEGRMGRKTEAGTAISFSNMDIESHDALRELLVAYADDPERVLQEFRAHHGLRRRDPL